MYKTCMYLGWPNIGYSYTEIYLVNGFSDKDCQHTDKSTMAQAYTQLTRLAFTTYSNLSI